jgi:hypothetical protein
MRKFTIACGLVLIALGAAAQTKPDFSGIWILNKARCTFEYPPFKAIEKGVATIEHREPLFKFHRIYTLGGEDDPQSWEHRTDGTETEGQEGRWKATFSMRWEGDVLVRTIRIQTSRGEALNTFRFSLLEEGAVLRIEELYKGPLRTFHSTWVFDRQRPVPSP